MTLGWQTNQQPEQGNALNLSQTGAPFNGYSTGAAGHAGYQPPTQGWYGQPQQPSMMNSLFAGMTGQDPYAQQQPMLPPSETEILMTMLDTSYPVERFMLTPAFLGLLETVSTIVKFSILDVLKGASFNFDEEEGVFKLDTASLREDLQTMSADNIIAQVTTLTSMVGKEIEIANNTRTATVQAAGNSMLQAQLAGALADPGLMTGAAEAGGSFMRNLMFGGRT